MKNIKKLTSAVLAILTVLNISTAVFAEDISEISQPGYTPAAVINDEYFEPEEINGITEEPIAERRLTKDVSAGYDKLLEDFTVTKASTGKTYAYYSPVVDENDTTKYPVVIYLHGKFHGWTNKTFIKSGLTYWSCTEIQSKFSAGGAHLIMPKLPEFEITNISKLQTLIEEYVNNNEKNVDRSQIFLMGGSAGGGKAWKLLLANPGYYKAAVMLCATKTLSTDEAKKVADIPIWEISSAADPIINYALNQSVTWRRLADNSNVKSKCRWSVFSGRPTLPDGSSPIISHFLAKTIGFDFCLIDNRSALPGQKTVNAEGSAVDIDWNNGIVEWMQSV